MRIYGKVFINRRNKTGTDLVFTASVESAVFGTHAKYIDLSNIHISQDMRRQGIGKELFALAKKWAREHGAEI